MILNTPRRQRGLSLVEVFVALLVLSVGLIALAKLQVDLVRGGSDAKARTAALNLVEEKIDDLRSFTVTQGSGTWSNANSGTIKPMAWSYIDTNAGGRIASQPVVVSGISFTRTWTVDSQYPSVAAVPPTNPDSVRSKDVTVTVSWVNELGVQQSVSGVASVVGIPPGNVAMASEPVSNRPPGPQVTYTPGAAPEIISVPIDTGTGKRETTKPLPDVQAQGGYANEVRFDVVNYHLDGSNNVVDRREEFDTVNCRCALAGPGTGRTPARVSFVGNVLHDQPGAVVSKSQTGVMLTSGTNSISQQPTLCAICCRDHHDGPAVTVGATTDYNRYNPSDTVNHQHYLWNSSTGTYTLASGTGDAYDEACRMKRVNGIFQVYQDWNLKSILAMPEGDLTNASIETAYQNYVQGFAQNQANNSLPGGTVPTFSTTTLVPAGVAQLSGRAIYMDQMPQNLIDFLNTSPPPNNFLSYVPFYEINLTKLANWKLRTISPAADYPTVSGQTCRGVTPTGYIACVANEAIVDESVINVGVYQNYYRGLLKGGTVTGSLDAMVYALNGNAGVTGTFALSTAQQAATPVSSTYRFSVDSGQAIQGTVTKGGHFTVNGNSFWSNIVIYAGATQCPPLTGTGNSSRAFSCTVPTGWTGTVTAVWSGHTFSPSSYSVTAVPASGLDFVVDP